MKRWANVTLVSGVLLCLVGGGHLLGILRATRPAAMTVARQRTRPAAFSDIMPGNRTVTAAPRLVSASPQLEQLLPGLQNTADDWRAFAPNCIVVRIAPDLALPFRVTKVQQENGRTVLTARLAKASEEPSDLDGSFLVSTANTPDRWEAIVVLPGDEYHIHVNRDTVTMEEAHPEALACGTDHLPAQFNAIPTTASRMTTGDTAYPTETVGMSGATVAMAEGNQTVFNVDVLFLYNTEALAARNGDSRAIDADCSNYIAAANTILVNSQITNFTWRYVACIPAPVYPTTSDLCDDLSQMGNGDIAAFTTDRQNTYGADQVVLLVGGVRKDYAGYACIGGDLHHSVVGYPACVATSGQSSPTSFLTICHEMAHNFGCRHDRQTEGIPTDNSFYYYGQRFNDATNFNADTGTVMSYSTGVRLPYFSNPNIHYHGYALGIPPGQSSSADNAKIMTEQAQAMAATTAPVTVPSIIQQPQSVTVDPGQRFDLSVEATGGNLTYRWYKDGAAINGASSSSYSVASAASSDACSYRVAVSNVLGTATSTTATVTLYLNTSAVPNTTGTAGAAAGGGAFDGIFGIGLSVLLVLGLGRKASGASSASLQD